MVMIVYFTTQTFAYFPTNRGYIECVCKVNTDKLGRESQSLVLKKSLGHVYHIEIRSDMQLTTKVNYCTG